MDEYKKVLAQNLRALRDKYKISQMELGELSNVSLHTISQIENETGNPTLETLVSLAIALKVDLNTLLPLK